MFLAHKRRILLILNQNALLHRLSAISATAVFSNRTRSVESDITVESTCATNCYSASLLTECPTSASAR